MKSGWSRAVWAMVTKELRTTLRERHQVVALAAIFVVTLGSIFVPAARWAWIANRPASPELRAATAPAATRVAGEQTDADRIREALLSKNPGIVRWVVVGMSVIAGIIFALGFITNAAIAAFAGEKDAKTLELALAAPVSDRTLLVGKCLAALVPGLTCGYAFLLLAIGGLWLILRGELAKLSVNVPVSALVLSAPLLVLACSALVIVCAAGSARAETVKGAGQVIGIVIFLLMFLFGGVPTLLRLTPLGPPMQRAFMAWLDWPFPAQYFGVVTLLLLVNAVLFTVARAITRRDQMLT